MTQPPRAVGNGRGDAAPQARRRRSQSWLGRAVVIVVLGTTSGGVAVLGAVVSRLVYRSDQVSVPWGLVLGVAASAAIVLVGRLLSRGLGFVSAAGWIIGTGLVLAGRPEGDYVLAQDGLGLGYLLLSVAVVISLAAFGGPPR